MFQWNNLFLKCNIMCLELVCKDCRYYLFPQMKIQTARWSGCWAPLVSSEVTLHVPWWYSRVLAWFILRWLWLWQVTLSGAAFIHQDGSDLPSSYSLLYELILHTFHLAQQCQLHFLCSLICPVPLLGCLRSTPKEIPTLKPLSRFSASDRNTCRVLGRRGSW